MALFSRSRFVLEEARPLNCRRPDSRVCSKRRQTELQTYFFKLLWSEWNPGQHRRLTGRLDRTRLSRYRLAAPLC